MKEATFGRDVADMLQDRMTFEEALNAEGLTIMTRQRLKIFRDKVFEQLSQSGVL